MTRSIRLAVVYATETVRAKIVLATRGRYQVAMCQPIKYMPNHGILSVLGSNGPAYDSFSNVLGGAVAEAVRDATRYPTERAEQEDTL